MRTLIVLSIFGLLFASGCAGTFTASPMGIASSWKFPENPSPEQAREAHAKLEEVAKSEIDAMVEGARTGNKALVEHASRNIKLVMGAKNDLGPYLQPPPPPVQVG